MTRSVSITRRLIVIVLVLEFLSAVALIAAMTLHERHMQLRAFDSMLEANASSLMGAVQDADDTEDNVILNVHEAQVSQDALFRVVDERGRVLGAQGNLPSFDLLSAAFRNVKVADRSYRFFVLHGVRTVDPSTPGGGIRHRITIIYGAPSGHIWHEVVEAIRFFTIATVILLGVTAAIMAWLVRKGLSPVHELAREAERISSSDWQFNAPASAKETLELQPLSHALEAALARLQRSFEQQKRFTNDAAHELKTDVAIVKSSLQLLSMRKRTIEEYGRGLALSLDDFTRLEMTVQKMLTLARLEQRSENDVVEAGTASCSLHDVIEEALHQSKSLAELRTVGMNVSYDVDVRVQLDRRDALLLCSNLLLNALQHSPEGSTVQIALTMKGGAALLTIQDQGDGISEDDQPYIFEPFYRGDPSRSRKSGGTGLGLSICRAICQQIGGNIHIVNTSAGGALATVTLPGVTHR